MLLRNLVHIQSLSHLLLRYHLRSVECVCRTLYLEHIDDDPLLDMDGVRLTDSALHDGEIIVVRSRDTLTGGDDAADDVIAFNESCRCSCCMLDLPVPFHEMRTTSYKHKLALLETRKQMLDIPATW